MSMNIKEIRYSIAKTIRQNGYLIIYLEAISLDLFQTTNLSSKFDAS